MCVPLRGDGLLLIKMMCCVDAQCSACIDVVCDVCMWCNYVLWRAEFVCFTC